MIIRTLNGYFFAYLKFFFFGQCGINLVAKSEAMPRCN